MRGRFQYWFYWACLAEAGLVGVAWPLGRWLDVDWRQALQWKREAAVGGVLTSLPLLGLFWLTLHARSRLLVAVRTVLEKRLRPVVESASIPQLAIISVLAGIGEEALFRGALQGGLDIHWGLGPALVVASLAFGAAHAVSISYSVVATAIGALLGIEYVVTGTLWTPIITHAAYDFLALVYWLRVYPVPAR